MSEASRRRGASVAFYAAACLVVATGIFLRSYQLGTVPGLDSDEVETPLQWFAGQPAPWYVSPSGRPLVNPLAPALLFPFAMLAHPAPWVVRVPSLLSGVALLPVTFVLMRRAFDRATALSATLLVSAAPILIAYSRMGYDPAYIPLVTMLATGCALQRRWAWTGVWAMLLVLVHPTGIFVMPVLAAPVIEEIWTRSSRARHVTAARLASGLALAAASGVGLVLLRATFEHVPFGVRNLLSIANAIRRRFFDIHGLAAFAVNLWRMFEGSGVYLTWAGGARPTPAIWAALAVVGLGAVTAASAWRLWRDRRRTELMLIAGLLAGLIAQCLVQGTVPFELFNERYILWAIVPICLVAAVVLDDVCRGLRAGRSAPAAACVVSVLWLSAFYGSYTVPFERRGGRSALLTYRSSRPDSKVQALDLIRREVRHPQTRATVFVGDARLELVLLYLASRDQAMDIKNLGPASYPPFQSDDSPALGEAYARGGSQTEDVFFVDYAWDEGETGNVDFIPGPPPSSLDRVVPPWTAAKIATVRGPDASPLVTIWRLVRR